MNDKGPGREVALIQEDKLAPLISEVILEVFPSM
jgi:hypothetical protein